MILTTRSNLPYVNVQFDLSNAQPDNGAIGSGGAVANVQALDQLQHLRNAAGTGNSSSSSSDFVPQDDWEDSWKEWENCDFKSHPQIDPTA